MNLKGLLLAGGIGIALALLVSHLFFPVSELVLDASRGERLFSENCAGCHSLEPNAPLLRGPSLHGIGEWAGSRVDGMSAEEYVFESIVAPDAFRTASAQGMMPGRFADELAHQDLLNITVFLLAQDKRIDYAALLRSEQPTTRKTQQSKPSIPIGEIERGEHLYQTLCMSCHDIEIAQSYDLYYPNLRQIGVHNRSYLREAILDPGKSITPGYETATLQTVDGQSFVGRLVYEDEIRLTLVVLQGNGFAYHEFARDRLIPFANGELVEKSPLSEMPPLGLALSEQDLDDLITFLTFM